MVDTGKAADIASTYIQVLITLASGIIVAIIGFYPTLLDIQKFNFLILHISLAFFVVSIVAGLMGLGGLINALVRKDIPTDESYVRYPALIQLVLFGIGIIFLFLSLPFSK
jgi:hypothetical protein